MRKIVISQVAEDDQHKDANDCNMDLYLGQPAKQTESAAADGGESGSSLSEHRMFKRPRIGD